MTREIPIAVSPRAHPFTPDQMRILRKLMDMMIPASTDGRMPAASSLGLYDDPAWLAHQAREALEHGLRVIDERARGTHGRGFADLAAEAARTLVDEARITDRTFIAAFTLQTTARYLQQDEVMIALGLDPRPPWPEGHDVGEGDWALLEPVRRRGELWRKV